MSYKDTVYTITGISNHGTIITVELTPNEGLGKRLIHFDHSPFRWMVEAETAGGTTRELEGRWVQVEPGEGSLIFCDLDDPNPDGTHPRGPMPDMEEF